MKLKAPQENMRRQQLALRCAAGAPREGERRRGPGIAGLIAASCLLLLSIHRERSLVAQW